MEDDDAMAMSRLPELARDSHLETTRTSEVTEHFFAESPTVVRREVWRQKRRIGWGAFGSVWVEECIAGHRPDNSRERAVKVIHLSGVHSNVYGRELEALAKFSQRKVCSLPCPT